MVVQKQTRQNARRDLKLQSEVNNLLARAGRKFLYYSDQIVHNLIYKKYTTKIFTKFIKFFKKNSKIPSHFLHRKLKIHKGNVFVNKIVNK